MVEEGFKVVFKGQSDSLETASASAAASIGNVIKAAAKVANVDAFRTLAQSAGKAVTNINAITGDLQKVKIDYTLPNFGALQRLIASVKGDINKAFVSVVPQPDTSPFTRAIAAMVASAERNLETLRNTRVNMGALRAPDLTPLRQAVETARKDLAKSALVTFPPPPRVAPIVIPAADASKFNQSVRTIQDTASRINTLLHSFESVSVPAIKPPSLTALENVVRDARANIDRTFLTPIPTSSFADMSKEVQGIITGLKEQKIQVPFAIQQPDLSNIRTGVENAKRTIQDSLNIKIPAPTVQPIPAPKTTGYTTAVQGAIKLINELSASAANVTTAVKPPDLTGYKAAITAVRNDLQNASLVKVPPVDAKAFNASITPLQKSIQQVNSLLQSLEGKPIQTPAVLPPNLVPLKAAVAAAKSEIESVQRIRMPEVQVAAIPPLDYRDFDTSVQSISSKVQQVNKLFTAVSDTPINAPALVPFDTKPLQNAVDVSKRLLRETASLALPFIETPDVKPIQTAPYLNSLTTLQQSTLAAQKVISGISALDVPAPVLNPPSLAPLFNAVQAAKKTIAGIDIELPKVTVQPIDAVAAPKIILNDFTASASELQSRIQNLNGLFRSVDAKDIPAPTLLPLDTHPLVKAVADVKAQIAAVKFAEIKMPTIAPVAVPPVDKSLFERSLPSLQASVQRVNQILQFASQKPIPTPAVLPPDLQPLRSAIAKAKAQIESVRLIEMPAIALPSVPALNSRLFDSSVVDIRTKIQNVNRLFNTVSDTPINAPALIPFDTKPLQNAVATAKREINEAANLKLPTLAVPTIYGLNTTAFNKSIGLLQKQVAIANSYLSDYGKTVIPTPVLPSPNLQPLFNAVATAKENIERSGTIKLPSVDMPTLQKVVIPPVDSAAFDASVNNLQSRVASVNSLFKTVNTAPIVPPAIQPPDTKPLYNAVADIKKQIASVQFATIDFPTIERVVVPPVDVTAFDRSRSALQQSVETINRILLGVSDQPLQMPAVLPPDLQPLRVAVREVQQQIARVKQIEMPSLALPTVPALDDRKFEASVSSVATKVQQINTLFAGISAEPIAPPAIRPPDLSALRDAVEKTRLAIANTADLRLPSIAAITLPPINQTAFNGSFTTLQSKVSAINNLFDTVDNTPIAAPLVAAPNFTSVLASVAKAKAGINNTFLEPIPLTAFTSASNSILGVFKSLNDQKLNIPFALPDTQTVINQVQAAKANIQKIWSAPVASPNLTINLPKIDVPKVIIPAPSVEQFNIFNAAVKQMVKQANSDLQTAFVTAIPAIESPFGKVLQGVDETVKRAALLRESLENIRKIQGAKLDFLVKTTVETPDFSKVRKAVAAANKNIDRVTIKPIKEFTDPFKKVVKGGDAATRTLIDVSRVAQDAPFGFIGIANNLNPLLESFQQLKKETGSSKSAFAALTAGLTGPAGLGLALSVASSLILAFGDKLATLFTRGNKVKEMIAGIFEDAGKNVGADLVKIDIFAKKLNDLSIPATDRIKIAREYNKVADETNQIDLKQISNLGLLNEKISAQTELIKQRAITTAALSKLTAASSNLIDTELKLQEALDASGLSYDKVKQAAQQAFKIETQRALGVGRALDGIKPITPVGDDSRNKINNVSNALISLFRNAENGRFQFDQLVESLKGFITIAGLTTKEGQEAGKIKLPKGEFDFFNKFFQFDPNKADATQKQIRELIDAAAAFRKEFGSGNGLKLAMPDFDTLNPAKAIAAARKYWADFQKGIVAFVPPKIEVDFSVVPKLVEPDLVPDFLENLRQGLEKNQKPVDMPLGIVPKLNTKSAEIKNFTDLGRQIGGKLGSVGGEAFAKMFQDAINNMSIGADAMQDISQSFKDSFAVGSELGSQFFSGLVQGVGSFTTALLNGENAMQSFGDAIMQTLKQMIVKLAEAAALAALLSIVSGGGTEGLSFLGAFKKIMGGGGIPGLATGGIIPAGYPSDSFPAMLSSGEAVIPLNKLSQYVNTGQAQQIVVVHERLRGNDLVRQVARTNRSQRRTG